jgi:hypothetical protein
MTIRTHLTLSYLLLIILMALGERLNLGVQQVGAGYFAVTLPETGFKEVKDLVKSCNLLGARLNDSIVKREFIRNTSAMSPKRW